VTHITEHDSKEEGEGDLGEDGGVDFLVHGDTIGVHNLLERPCEVVDFDVSGRLNCVVSELLEVSGGVVLQDFLDSGLVIIWRPEVADVGVATNLEVVQLEVEVLLLGNEPLVDFEGADFSLLVSSDLVDLDQVLLELSL
jgi:hypothetical protein